MSNQFFDIFSLSSPWTLMNFCLFVTKCEFIPSKISALFRCPAENGQAFGLCQNLSFSCSHFNNYTTRPPAFFEFSITLRHIGNSRDRQKPFSRHSFHKPMDQAAR
jgi:hypothetical protein